MLLTLLAPLALSIPFDKFGLTQYWVQYGENLTFLAKIYLLLTNFAIFGQEWTLILSVGANADQLLVDPMRGVPMWMFLPVGQAWSLSLELMFYLLIPFLSRSSTLRLIVLLGASLILHLIVAQYAPSIYESGPHRFFPTALRFFLLGMLSARFYSWVNHYEMPRRAILAILFITLAVHLGLLAFSHEVAVWAVALVLPFLFLVSRSSRIDRIVGEYSYSIYIIHIGVLYTLKFYGFSKLGNLVFLISLFLSYCLQKFVTNYFDHIRESYGARNAA